MEEMHYHIEPRGVLDLIARLSFPRVVGTEGEKHGFDVTREALTAFGVDAWFEEFSSPWIEIAEAYCQVGDTRLAIEPVSTPLFNGPWIPVPEDADVEGVLVDRVHSEETTRSQILVRTELDIENVCIPGASAQLFACAPEEGFEAYYLAAVGRLEKPVPSAYVDPEIRSFLAGVLGATCRFRWASRRCERTLRNLVADIRGMRQPDEVIAVGAHIDSFPGTVGANDNASGCARLVTFARWFREHPPLRTIRFIWFTGEELDRRGSYAYVKAHAKDRDRIVLFLNVDGGVSRDHECLFVPEGDVQAVMKFTQEFLGEICGSEEGAIFRQPKEFSDNSDVFPFQEAGIPALFLPGGGRRKSSGPNPHLPTDTLDIVDPENIRIAATLGIAFLDSVQQYRPGNGCNQLGGG